MEVGLDVLVLFLDGELLGAVDRVDDAGAGHDPGRRRAVRSRGRPRPANRLRVADVEASRGGSAGTASTGTPGASQAATEQPLCASASTMARPMPPAAPVTSTRRPLGAVLSAAMRPPIVALGNAILWARGRRSVRPVRIRSMPAGTLELLKALVAIDNLVNPSLVAGGAGERQIATFVAGWARDCGLEVDGARATPGRPSVVVRARGRGGGAPVPLRPLDTVTVEGMRDPFTPRAERRSPPRSWRLRHEGRCGRGASSLP